MWFLYRICKRTDWWGVHTLWEEKWKKRKEEEKMQSCMYAVIYQKEGEVILYKGHK